MEALTPTVARLYKEDRITQFVFILLALFCLASFGMAIGTELGIAQHVLLGAQLLILALSLDMLRWHNRRVATLMDPLDAVNRVLARTTWELKHVQKTVARLAKIDWRGLSDAERINHSPERLESAYYIHKFDPSRINFWASELAEIAVKSVGRSDTYLAVHTVSAIGEIGRFHVQQRRLNITYTMKTLGVYGCDAENILTPLYEHLQNINRAAVSAKSERVAIQVVRCLAQVAAQTLQLRLPDPSDTRSPIVWLPLGYMKGVIQHAQLVGLDNVGLEGSQTYLALVQGAPQNVEMGSFYSSISENLHLIVQTFLVGK